MPTERATVFNRLQLGLEVTPGTPVAAGIQLLDTMITPRPRIPTAPYRPMGSKVATSVTVQKGWTEFGLEGAISYIDLPYLLSSVLTKAAVAGTWQFAFNPFAPDDPQVYTMEYGSSAGAERFAFGLISALELTFSTTESRMRGNGIGRKMADGITLTASPTIKPSQVVSEKTTSVFVGDSVGGLVNAGRFFEAAWNITGRYGPVMTLDATQDSFSNFVELVPTYTARLVCAKNSTAAGYMTDLDSAKTKFMRIKSTGAIFTGTTAYDIQITFPFKFQEPDQGDRAGVYASTFPLIPVYDATFGAAMEVIVVNDQATL